MEGVDVDAESDNIQSGYEYASDDRVDSTEEEEEVPPQDGEEQRYVEGVTMSQEKGNEDYEDGDVDSAEEDEDEDEDGDGFGFDPDV